MTAALEVRNVSYTYPSGKQALRDVSFRVEAGEKVALVGANGAGKSTLLLHLNGILSGEGEVLVHGEAISKQNLGRVRARVGMVFQNPDDQLFSPTVFEDVAYGPIYQGSPKEEVEQRVKDALRIVGMEALAGESPQNLSGGEKKRIAIATVLSMEPEILVLDEPTAGLDPRGRRELVAFLQGLPRSMLVATHDLNLARQLASRVLVLGEGRLVAEGATENILGDQALLEEYGLY